MRHAPFIVLSLLIFGCGKFGTNQDEDLFNFMSKDQSANPFKLADGYISCNESYTWVNELFYARRVKRPEIDLEQEWLVLESSDPTSGFISHGSIARSEHFKLAEEDREVCRKIREKAQGSKNYYISYELEQFFDFKEVEKTIDKNEPLCEIKERDAVLTFNLRTLLDGFSGPLFHYRKLFSVPVTVQCEEPWAFKKNSENDVKIQIKTPEETCFFKSKNALIPLSDGENTPFALIGFYEKHSEYPEERIAITIESYGFKR
jgi:hypothetical protein